MNDLTIYQQHRTQMKTGDALLYRSKGSLIGWIIQKFSDFNHIGGVLRFGPDEQEVDRVWTLEAVGRGVKPSYLSEKIVSYHGEIWWYPLKDEFDDHRKFMQEAALILKDIDYDFKSLFKNVLGYVSVNLKTLFCSEYYYFQLCYAKIITDNIGIAPRPGDIPKLNIFKEPFKLT